MAAIDPTKTTRRDALLGYGFAALAAIGFSGKAILVKLAYADTVDALTLLTLRMAFSLPFFLLTALRFALMRSLPPLSGKDYPALLLLGLSGYYAASLFDFLGLQYISAGLERLILFLYPTMVIILSALLLSKPFGRKEAVALLFSYAGIGVVFADQIDLHVGKLWLGAALVFASTLSYSFYLLGAGKVIGRIGASRFTAYAMLVACFAVIPHFLLTHSLGELVQPPRVYWLSLLMAVFSTVLPVFLLSSSIRRIGSGHASLIGSIGPVATLFMAEVFLDEKLTLPQIGGAALVLAGVLSLTRK